MSKNSKNILGNQQGKIGNIVGRVVNGVQIYSAYGGKGHDPRTPKQVATRAKFSAITLLSNILCGPIAVGFRRAAAAVPMTSPRNIFVKRNFALMQYDAETGIVTPDYEHIVVSDGRVLSVEFATPSFAEAASITVTFTPDIDIAAGAFAQDTVYVAAYCPEEGQCQMALVNRSVGEATLSVLKWTGKTVHLWGFVRTSVEEPTVIENYGLTLRPNDCSPSSYLGTGTVA